MDTATLASSGNTAGAAARAALSPATEAKLRKTARDFEAMFLEQMLERVVATEGEGPLGENGAGGAIYRSMLVKEYAGTLADRGTLGVAPMIYSELLRLQESAPQGNRP